MTRPILFLDIDGVLNSRDWEKRRVRPPMYDNLERWRKEAEDLLDPEAVARLNTIVEASGCAVVLSSTWRKGASLPCLTRQLRYRGFKHRLLAATPHLFPEPGEIIPRGHEIAEWLNMIDIPADRIAILDDDSDMDPLMWALVKTDHAHGLTDVEVEKVLELL